MMLKFSRETVGMVMEMFHSKLLLSKKLLHKSTALILVGYVFTRLPFLIRFPIFNDEAIYLDWGWAMVTNPELRFLSLMDGKQPLLIWLFGLFQKLPLDPLVAGRLVSFFIGFLTLCGLYHLGKLLGSNSVAFWSSWIYVFVPVFIFFDSLALMESAIAAVGVWVLALSLHLYKTRDLRFLFCLILISAVGLWIKSSAILFVIASVIISLYLGKQKSETILMIAVYLLGLMILLLPLGLHRDAKLIFTLNDRFGLSLSEIMSLPLTIWAKNFWALIETNLVQVLGFMLLGFSGWHWSSLKNKVTKALFLYQGILLFAAVLLTRNLQIRYLISFLPLLLVLIVYVCLASKKRIILELQMVVLAFLSFLLISSPYNYFRLVNRYNPSARMNQYFIGYSSGYGVKEAFNYVLTQARQEVVRIIINPVVGNPQNAIAVYARDEAIQLKRTSAIRPEDIEYLEVAKTYYITRNDELIDAGDGEWKEVEAFYKPDMKDSVRVYRLKI